MYALSLLDLSTTAPGKSNFSNGTAVILHNLLIQCSGMDELILANDELLSVGQPWETYPIPFGCLKVLYNPLLFHCLVVNILAEYMSLQRIGG